MPTECIPYKETNYFTDLTLDYLAEKEELKSFYNRFPNLENFKAQIEEKSSFPQENRKVLVNALQEQYSGLEISEATQKNIKALENEETFTVVTGHQLNLFTGPLYFLYKIVSTINLTQKLKEKYPENNFVPIYWMATEDHDFEEINFFNLNGKKFQWANAPENAERDAVGNLSTHGLEDVFKLFSAEIGGGKDAEFLKELFKKAYLEHDNLAEATLFVANELFKEEGLVILDAQQKSLKELFIPYAKNELLEQISHKTTTKTAEKLNDLGYNVQVNPREINLFYLNNGLRERIIERDGEYFVHETEIKFTKAEILEELQHFPERFSPNVMLRPLYQEVILPNLCYIGGSGEIAYWLELKEYFAAENVIFPVLLLRNSAMIQSEKLDEKRRKLNISNKELFLKQHELINRKVRQISNIDIDFSKQKEHLVKQFQQMYDLAEQTDKSFIGAVKAQEVKQLKGLNNLEKRLLKAQKRKLEDEVSRIAELQNELFPNKALQERQTNFSEIYAEYGPELISVLLKELDPLQAEFKILTFGKE
ncbi:bacillithiol biosynthesis cysteine-adding enzyme BshC [Salegentibacter salinarum]|uniref:Putative cysteine ligase BshC n=1 Tax=Salegentibacter salinarum TaxID=447422 RepID=A0A2N0TUG9_9FLAO|nr:bacillithiol biosynthesis cysteine-adding enzyme BshC [Salegentibacter salinarum]PKD18374.1 bacillithiol biosynthesis cysteine-adding enzyme BshC [Salegentibacter salinarum]SKB44739.1 bacillithiol biosynthesis cysteine-adding enzyme BshC [Salegentibacter salinarum]